MWSSEQPSRARRPTGFIRTALGVVLVGSGIVTIQKGDPTVWPIAAAVAALGLGGDPRRPSPASIVAARRKPAKLAMETAS